MADQRIVNSVHITDPTTSTQQQGVDASGNAKVILASNTGVDIGDTDVTSVIPGTGATNLGKAIDSVVGATDTCVGALFKRVDTPGTITPADGDWAPGQLDSQGYLRVKDPNAGAGSPTSPVRESASTSALAAGSSARVDHSTDLGGLTRKLTQVTVSGSRAFKAVVQETENGAVVQDKDVIMSPGGGGTVMWKPPHKDYLSTAFSANAGFDGFSVTFTNLDAADAADFYATFYWET